MKLIVCVDDNLGTTFFGKRQSQDRILREEILKLTQSHILRMDEYSAKMFGETAVSRIIVSDDPVRDAATGEYCFVEKGSILLYENKIEEVILYRWNRAYPADRRLEIDLNSSAYQLKSTRDFTGSSHDKITEEVYVR